MQADYPQIRAVIWFHINKETDWRINSSPESQEAFKQAVAGDYWLDVWPGMME
jgi:endoglucanase